MLAGLCDRPRAGSGAWVLTVAILGSSMAFIDGTVVNVALPALQSALHATITDVQWVVESYALFLAALLLTGGSLGDRLRPPQDIRDRRDRIRRRFGLVRLRSEYRTADRRAWSARNWRGTAGPGKPGADQRIFPCEGTGRAIGTWSGFTSITAAIGPVLGGWLVQHGSWRWVFFINLPVALAVLVLTIWRVPESRSANTGQAARLAGRACWPTIGLGRHRLCADRIGADCRRDWR